jgi:2-oxoglutarate ferredoxin oxidoreductase subunit alpha
MRVRAFPFPPSVRAFIESHERCYVVEQNRDGQLRTLLAIETGVARDRMSSVLDYGGLPLTAERVVRGVVEANSSPRAMANGASLIRTGEPVSTSS